MELKPCPFCGGPAVLENNGAAYEWVACMDCGNRTIEFLIVRSAGHAIAAWNRRALSDAATYGPREG